MATTLTAKNYVARVERDETGAWIASVPSLRGVHTHARSLSALRRHLQDAIAVWLELDLADAGVRDPHVDRAAVGVELRVALPPAARRAAEHARRRRELARSTEAEASVATREAAQALVEAGLSRRDTAQVLGLSHQRIDQLLRSI